MSEVKPTKKAQKPVERVVIEDQLKEKLIVLTNQANDALQGMATVTKGDVINLLLREHAETLSSKEVEALKVSHVDQVKLAFWLAREMKEKRAAGENLSLKELYERCEAMLPRKPERKVKRAKDRSNSEGDESSNLSQAERLESERLEEG